MKMKTLKEGIVAHADGLGKLFKFSAEHTCRSMLHSLEGFANMEFVTFKELTAGFFLGFETGGVFAGRLRVVGRKRWFARTHSG